MSQNKLTKFFPVSEKSKSKQSKQSKKSKSNKTPLIHHHPGAIFSSDLLGSLNKRYSNYRKYVKPNSFPTVNWNDENEVNKIIKHIKNKVMFEYTDTKQFYVKPNFDIDCTWADPGTPTHRDSIIILTNALKFIKHAFQCTTEDMAVLFDNKPYKCSFHVVIHNTYCHMDDLIKFKNTFLPTLKALWIDEIVYREKQSKFRCIFGRKEEKSKTMFIPYENNKLGISIHPYSKYFAYFNTNDKQRHWVYDTADMKSFQQTYPDYISNDVQEDICEYLVDDDPQPISKSKNIKLPSKPIHREYQQPNQDEVKMIDELVKYACDKTTRKKSFHTHDIITLSAKGLVNSGFIEQAKYIILNSMNDKNKNLQTIANDAIQNSHKTDRSVGSFHHFFQTHFSKDTWFNITNKYKSTQLIPSLHDELFTLKSESFLYLDDEYLPSSILKQTKDHKTIFLKSHLGTGKTTIMKQFIGKNQHKRILYLAPRITFAKQVHFEINDELDEDNQFTFYGDLKSDSTIQDKQRIIIQMESLHKVQGIKYDIVICDEIESCLCQLSSVDTMANKIMENHDVFEKLILNAKTVFCCDAFLSTKSIDIMNKINQRSIHPGESITIVNKFNPYKRKSYEIKNIDALKTELFRQIKNNKRIVFVCCAKDKADAIHKQFIDEFPDKKIKYYYGNMSESDKVFTNVDNDWNDVDLLMYTPILTVGVSYNPEIPTFNSLFMYATASSALIRDDFQASLRVRKLIDNDMYYTLSSNSTQKNNTICGLSENYQNVHDRGMFVIDKTTFFKYNDAQDWIKWNCAYNQNEEGINKHYFEQTFRDMLNICGYTDLPAPIPEKKWNKKNKIETSIIPLDDITKITQEQYEELQKNPYKQTEDEKMSIKLYECEEILQVDDSVWEQLHAGRNSHIYENLKYEFKYTDNMIQALTKKDCETVHAIYSKNTHNKLTKVQELNALLGFKNSLKINYSTQIIDVKKQELTEFIEDSRKTFGYRKSQSKSKELSVKYINRFIHKIYTDWNGCIIKSDKYKIQKTTHYKYTIDGAIRFNKLK